MFLHANLPQCGADAGFGEDEQVQSAEAYREAPVHSQGDFLLDLLLDDAAISEVLSPETVLRLWMSSI